MIPAEECILILTFILFFSFTLVDLLWVLFTGRKEETEPINCRVNYTVNHEHRVGYDVIAEQLQTLTCEKNTLEGWGFKVTQTTRVPTTETFFFVVWFTERPLTNISLLLLYF